MSDQHQKITDLEKGDCVFPVDVPSPSKLAKSPLSTKNDSSMNDSKKDHNEGKYTPSIENADSVLEEDSDDANVVGWDSPNDPQNPLNWPAWRRWTLISLVSAITFMAGLSSSMFAPGVPALMKEFHSTNETLGSFVVTIFVLGFATGPLFFAPLSELYGRTAVQYVGCFGFLIFSIACASSRSLNVLIGMRLLQGTFASCPLTNGGGIIADMVRQEERGFAMSMFTLGTLLGPVIGPVAGALLSAAKGWRWVFWIISMMLGVLFGLCLIFWRESYAPVLLARKAAQLRKETGNLALRSKYDIGLSPRDHFNRGIFRPIKMLVFSPILTAMCLHMGLAYAYFYLLFTTFTQIFKHNYHFTDKTVGLSYLGVGIGFLVGQAICAKLGDSILMRLTNKHGGEMKPEYRLPLCCIGGCFIPIGFFWYGWSAEEKVFWIVPIIGTAVVGFGNSLVFISIQAYTIDAFTLYAASGLAANTVTRSVMAAVLPLAAPKLYASLGLGWGNSLLAFLALAMVPIPVFLFIYGEQMRGWNSERLKRL